MERWIGEGGAGRTVVKGSWWGGERCRRLDLVEVLDGALVEQLADVGVVDGALVPRLGRHRDRHERTATEGQARREER
eukprot:5199722-Pleurochrysis_carterae.AAC.2